MLGITVISTTMSCTVCKIQLHTHTIITLLIINTLRYNNTKTQILLTFTTSYKLTERYNFKFGWRRRDCLNACITSTNFLTTNINQLLFQVDKRMCHALMTLVSTPIRRHVTTTRFTLLLLQLRGSNQMSNVFNTF